MIVLIQINYTEDHSEKILPLGILSVGSALSRFGRKVRLFNINEKQISETARDIAALKPLFVGISVMTGVQTRHSAWLSKELKKIDPNLVIAWGGIHPSLLPEQCLAEDYVDYVMIGEGEEVSNEFAAALESRQPVSDIAGLGWKQNGQPVINPKRPFLKNLGEWQIDWSLLDVEDYVYKLDKYDRTMAYKASRGCPFGCAFCYNNLFNQNRWRAWPADQVIADINKLKERFKINAIKFYDDNFFVDKARALKILQAIDLPSHIEVRIDMIDDSLARSLSELNVYDMLIGLESGSDRMLKLIDKNFTVERMVEGVKSIAKYDLRATYSFIVGLPTETEEEFWQTIDLMYKIYQIHPRAAFTLGAYLPYPGSKMYEFSKQQGFAPPAKTEDWGSIDRFRKDFTSPWVDAKKVWVIRECYKFMSLKFPLFKLWFEFRIKHRLFFFSFDIAILESLMDVALSEKGWIGKSMRRMYNYLRK